MTDEELYNLFCEGQTDALDELLVRHKSGLTLFLYSLVGNMEDAEDLMMDAFATLLSKRVRFLGKSSFKSWLYGIGRNLARNQLRKKKDVPFGDDLELVGEEGGDDVIKRFFEKERNRGLYAAISKLPEDYKTVIYLQYFEDMSVSDICRAMKKNEKQVYNLTARAKEKLKTFLETDGGVNGLL